MAHEEFSSDVHPHPLWTPAIRRRTIFILIGILLVVLLAVLPPYVSISRYQRRVTSAMSEALGRPVRVDSITLHLLPLPGLTLQNFVAGETPDFGSEPVLRANTVEVRLRLSSLWRRRIEVSRISLEAPSINLVRNLQTGRWNLQRIVTQAAQMSSAPTAQKNAGEAPRFPYIEATDARLNIKNGEVKLPFALREAEFALWLPEPGKWQLRLSGKPVRTDTDVSDVGVVTLEATLGRSADVSSQDIDLSATWKPTPLGEATKLVAGEDLNWRGEVSASATLKGSLKAARLNTDVHLLSLRREDFVPEQTAEINAHCEGATTGLLRTLHDLRCAIPTKNDTSFLDAIEFLRRTPPPVTAHDMPDAAAKPGVFLLRGEIPDTFSWSTATLHASLKDASPNYGLAWMRLFSRRIPQDLSLDGALDLAAWKEDTGSASSRWGATVVCTCTLPPPRNGAPAPVPQERRWNVVLTNVGTGSNTLLPHTVLTVTAYPAEEAAAAQSTATEAEAKLLQRAPQGTADRTITGSLDRNGYTLVFPAVSLAEQTAGLLPPLGDGMPAEPDTGRLLQTARHWNGTPVWTEVPAPEAVPKPLHHRR